MNSLATVRQHLTQFEMAVGRLEGERDSLLRLKTEASDRQTAAIKDKDQHEQALKVLQGLEEAWRHDFQKGLAAVVSQGLTAVFGEKMEVELENSIVRDVASTEIVLITAEGERISLTENKLGGVGGGLKNVLGFLFRILMLISVRPRLARILPLDEPFQHIDEYALPESVGILIRDLAKKVEAQFLIASHEPQLVEAADVAYEVKKKDGESFVRRISNLHHDTDA